MAIIVGLFAVQRRGTAVVGEWFGPVMLVWFTAVGALGLHGVLDDPGVLRGLSPTYAVQFFQADGLTAFLSLGGVVLAITGAEALYADLGHFGASPIRRAWLVIVFPALILNYLGQGSLILRDPAAAANPFFHLVPHVLLLPMVLLATAATVIASQAVISGAFSLTRQAVRLGYLPSLEIRHTSVRDPGQVFLPLVNMLLMLGVLVLVVAFGSSASLAAAYGIAVTGTMLITGVLYFSRAFGRARRGRPAILAAAGAILTVDVAFLAANAVKIPSGGWLPLLVAAIAFTVMAVWHTGHDRVDRRRRALEGPLREYIDGLAHAGRALRRIPGTAIFLARPGDTTPPALRAVVERIHALHELVVVVTVEVTEVPHVPVAEQAPAERMRTGRDGIVLVHLRLGFDDVQSVPRVLRRVEDAPAFDGALDLDHATYFVSVTSLRAGTAHGLDDLRQRLYLATARLATDPVRYFHLPPTRTLTVGSSLVLE